MGACKTNDSLGAQSQSPIQTILDRLGAIEKRLREVLDLTP